MFEHILFTQYSFGRFMPAVLSLVIGLFLFVRKRQRLEKPAPWLTIYFLFVFIFHAGYFLAFSIYHESGAMFWLLPALAPVGIVFLIQFAYRFPERYRPGEARIVFIITLTLGLLSFLDYLVRSLEAPVRVNMTNYGSAYNSQIIPVFCLFFFLWAIFVLLRQALRLSREEGSVLSRLVSPGTGPARAARNLALIVLLEIVNSVLVVMFMSFNALSIGTINTVMNTLTLCIYVFYVIVYINSSGEPLLLTTRLAGISLVTVLVVLEIAGQYALTVRDSSYDERNRIVIHSLAEKQENGEWTGVPREIEYIVRTGEGERNFVFNTTDLDSFTAARLLGYRGSGLTSRSREGEKGLSLSGRWYLREKKSHYFHYNTLIQGARYGIGFSFDEYRKYMHPVARDLIYMTVLFVILSLLLSPLALSGGLIHPLQKLLGELRQSTGLTPEVEDEILHLTKAMGITLMKNRQMSEELNELKEKLIEENRRKKDQEQLSPAAEEKILQVIDYIKNNYHYEISREGLASYCGMSLSALSRGFKQYTGMKMGDLINRLRVRDAMLQLENTEKTVLEIALSVGFESLRTFNRVFLRVNGLTPTEYREKGSPGRMDGRKLLVLEGTSAKSGQSSRRSAKR
jgi:AraC-like DNA-binding protein